MPRTSLEDNENAERNALRMSGGERGRRRRLAAYGAVKRATGNLNMLASRLWYFVLPSFYWSLRRYRERGRRHT